VDDENGIVTNLVDFSVTGTGTLSGSSTSRYESQEYLCEWGYTLGMVPAANPGNQMPAAVITSPQSGTVFSLGETITFTGSGNDPEDGALIGPSLVWTSSIDGRLDVGETFTHASLSAGNHQITLTAVDSLGGVDTQTIGIVVNSPPAVTISSPAPGTRIDPGGSVIFSGSANDPEDGPLDAEGLIWRSSIDGALGTGRSLTVASLSYGLHTITAVITDSQGKSGSSSVTMKVNYQPSVSVSQPAANSHFTPGFFITFDGSASDPEDTFLPFDAFVWSSDLDGQLAIGSYTGSAAMSYGVHTLTCTVTDSLGDSGSQSVAVVINTPPVATITLPFDGSMEMPGTPISCTATSSDAEDTGFPNADLVWTYQELPTGPEIEFGTGNSATITFSDFGTFRIRFTVTDSMGDVSTDSVDFFSGG
jgi:hypothetical protein